MCKIMILTGIEDSELALKFMQAASIPMSFADRDGIGYSAINSNNQLFMEKWHNNSKFLDIDSVLTKEVIAELAPFKARLPSLTENYSSYGQVTRNDLRTVTMHTRMATCGRTFENTHPFIDQEVSLIHNGVISNSFQLNLNKVSTCDSESALQLYINNEINLTDNEQKIQETFLDKLRGYWAFGILAKDANGQYMIDIVREGASLYWSEIPEIGKNCYAFATTENIIKSSLISLGLPKRKIHTLPEYNYHRFNAVTGEYINDFTLAEGILNKPYVYPTYKKDAKTDTRKDYSDKFYDRDYSMYDYYDDIGYNPNLKIEDESKDILAEATEITKVSDEFIIEGFYDVDEPLLDRLYEFDELMGTSYGNSFENIQLSYRVFIERKEEEDYIIFDDILKIIEEFNASKLPANIFKAYRELKRA